MPRPLIPENIRFETENYLVRDLEPDDATERVCGWMADPRTADMLNAPARTMTAQAFGDYVSGHDRIDGHVLGVFDKVRNLQIGMWSVFIDWQLREFLVNVLIPEAGPGELGPRRETLLPLLELMFEVKQLETVRCSVLARNVRIGQRLEEYGMAPEHKSTVMSAHGDLPEEIHHYSVNRQSYREMRDAVLRKRAQKAMLKAG